MNGRALMRGRVFMGALVAAMLTAAGGQQAWAVAYTVIDLTPSGLSDFYGYGIVGSQQVGYGPGALIAGNTHAILWSGTAASAIDLNPSGFTGSLAYGIGGIQQVGFGNGPATGNENHAILWNGTAASAVDLNPVGVTSSAAYASNGSQQVGFGTGAPTGGNWHALLWSGTAASAVDLTPSGFTSSIAYGTDGSRQAGWASGPGTGEHSHALLWNGTASGAIDLNPIGFSDSIALGIGGSRQVGYGRGSVTANDDHALLWSGTPTSALDLNPSGYLNSFAFATNGSQQVGDAYGPATGGFPHAILWSGTASSALDLHQFLPSGFRSSYARGINAVGEVVGYALDGSGNAHAMLWKAVPEPCTLVMLVTGLVFVVLCAWRRRRRCASLVALAIALTGCGASNAVAQTSAYWRGSYGNNWSDNRNWVDGNGQPVAAPPDIETDVYINQAPTCVINGSAGCHSLHLGTDSDDIGALLVQAGGELTVGHPTDPQNEDLLDNLYVGDSGSGTLTIQGGGIVECYGCVWVGKYTGSTGAINVSGGGELDVSRDMFLSGHATFQQQGGVWYWQEQAGGTGTLNISGDANTFGIVEVMDFFDDQNFHGTLVLCKPDDPQHTSVTVDQGTLLVESLEGVEGSKIYIEDRPEPSESAMTIWATGNAPPEHPDPADDAGNFRGEISGPGSITKVKGSVQTLSGNNTYSGETVIEGGTLRLGSSSALNTTAITVLAGLPGSTLDLDGHNITSTIPMTISGAGQNNMGALINSNTGAAATCTAPITLDDDTSMGGAGNLTLTGSVSSSDTYHLTKIGQGTLTVTATNNSYSGGTTVSQGTLVVTNPGALPGYGANGMVMVSSGAMLTLEVGGSGWTDLDVKSLLDHNASGFAVASTLGIDTTGATAGFSYGYSIAGNMGLTKFGLYTLTLTGNNTYIGVTTVIGGTLQIGAGGTTGTLGQGSVTDSASLVFDRSDTLNVSNLISGSGTLSQIGSGVLFVAATNTYTGVTYVDNGILQYGGDPANVVSHTASIRVRWKKSQSLRGGTLDLNGHSIASTVPVYLDGTGTATFDPTKFDYLGALINSAVTIGSSNTNAPRINGDVYAGTDSPDMFLCTVSGIGWIKFTGSLNIADDHTFAFVRALVIVACTIGTIGSEGNGVFQGALPGASNMNMNLGRQDDGDGPFCGGTSTASNVQAELTAQVSAPNTQDSALIGLEATGPGNAYLSDCHTLKNLIVDANSLGTAKIVLGQGDPFGSEPNGSVLVQVYIAGTAPGADPRTAANRQALEDLWQAICTGFYQQGSAGITSDAPDADGIDVGLSLLVRKDSYGARYLAITTSVLGDVNGDGMVTSLDLNALRVFKNRPLGWTNPYTGVTYNRYTWIEGDLNGDGVVTQADEDILIAHFAQQYHPGGTTP